MTKFGIAEIKDLPYKSGLSGIRGRIPKKGSSDGMTPKSIEEAEKRDSVKKLRRILRYGTPKQKKAAVFYINYLYESVLDAYQPKTKPSSSGRQRRA